MNVKNRILFSLSKKIIEKNRKFAQLHNGESCYIFGNGASLKYFELKKFDDKIAIACNAFFLHRDFRKINVKYYYIGETFFYYPYWRNPYNRKILEKNYINPIFKGKGAYYNNVNYFVSLSNYLGIQGGNIYYLHHFGKSFNGYSDSRMDNAFTPMTGSFSAMLGVAIFMGFSDITIVGCDYTFFPQGQNHFYEFGKFPDAFQEEPFDKNFLIDAMRHADIQTVTPSAEYRGHVLPYISYKELTGNEPVYKENYEIVAKSDLSAMSSSGLPYYIFP